MNEGDKKGHDRDMQTIESVGSKGGDGEALANHDTMTVTSGRKSDRGWGGGSGNSGDHERIDRTGKKDGGVNLSLFPEAQASAAIGAQPMNISVIDGLWGFTLFRKQIASAVSSTLTRLGSVALDAAPYVGRFAGVAVGAMWPRDLGIPEDEKFKAERQRMIIQAIQASQVTKTPVSQLATMSSVVTDIQVQDVIEKDKQTLAIVRTPAKTVSVPVVKAVKTKRQNVFTAKVVPSMPPVHIRISDPPRKNIFSKKEVTPVADVPVKPYTPAPVKNTVDAIVYFPAGSNAEPVYVSVTTVLSAEEAKKQAAEAKRQQEAWKKAHPVEAAERQLYEADQVFKPLDKIYQEKQKALNQAKSTPEGKALADPIKSPLVFTKDIELNGKKLKVEIKTDSKKGLDILLKEGVKAYMLAMTRSDFKKLQGIKDPKEAQLQSIAALLKAVHFERFGRRLLNAHKIINPAQNEFNIAMENRKKAEQAKVEAEKNRDKVKEENRKKRKGVKEAGHDYYPAPKTEEIKGLGELKRGPQKTPKQNGGGKRKRWIGEKGRKIYEWDSRHGELEGYRASDGQHIGVFDHETGKQLAAADPERSIKKFL
ncbi:colicin-like bacteriocin tRNase domain-containing protein [Photorhabdus sp. RM323S]|uniref:colicin-like bacteriocin tRNase domain-containing protein n=1 Tax=Photorhabdus sp. RM323S TaxID=3342828 RepID=UPI0036DC719F